MKKVVAEWSGGEVWVPYTTTNMAEQERVMQAMLDTGQYVYHDARRIHREFPAPPQYFWVLRRISRKEYRRIMNGRILKPETVERISCEASRRVNIEVDSTGEWGRADFASDLKEIPIPGFDSRQK